MPYVPALDGLRAFAVLCVVLYHLKTVWAPCGLLGVTVFFVLSGYLITSLIVDEWRRTHHLDLKLFWIKRLRRIMPAIAFLLLALVPLCAIFSPVMLTKLRNDFIPSLLFYNNWWQIFQNVSYFENLGSPSPVTHLWSLAIEEQFYIVQPLVLILLFKLRSSRRTVANVLGVLAIASVVEMAILYQPDGDPSRVYYGTDTRAFSLLIGAWFAVMFPAGKARSRRFARNLGLPFEVGALVSLVVIVWMVFTVSAYEPFLYRGGFFLVSVLSGIAIVGLCAPHGLLARVFSLAPLVWLGKRSYGLYLWHYPLLLLMNPPTDFEEPSPFSLIVQVVVILAATEFSYHFIETPIRHGVLGRTWHALRDRLTTPGAVVRTHPGYAASLAALLVAVVVCWIAVPPTLAVEKEGGAETLDPAEVVARQNAEPGADAEGEETSTPKVYATAEERLADLPADPAQWNVLLVGDSVAETAYPQFTEYFVNGAIDAVVGRTLEEGTWTLQDWMNNGWNGDCVVLVLGTNTYVSSGEFEREYTEALDSIPANVPVFVLTNRDPLIEGSPNNEIITRLSGERDNVYLIDWYNLTAAHSDWFEKDGAHVTVGYGAEQFLNTIIEAMRDAQASASANQAPQAQAEAQEQPSAS